jgi:hypothetical protein
MVGIDPSILSIQPPLEPFVERKLRARSQDDARDRARAVTMEMVADGRVLVARSWVDAARGGTLTLVFARHSAAEDETY